MWSDNETDKDFLNFTGVSETVAEIIIQAKNKPISIGVSGAWGVGKSSMIKLIQKALENRVDEDPPEFVFVEFNAWLYQGYDDARASLLEVIATKLEQEAEKRKTGLEQAKDLLQRVNWLRAVKVTATSALALSYGLPPPDLLGEILRFGRKALGGEVEIEDVEKTIEEATDKKSQSDSILKSKPKTTPPKEINSIRTQFEDTLSAMNVKLVVLIDDLDRCLPPTTISTLEGIRLFLFLKNTAFVIAADDAMIKHAVRQHFDGVDETLVTNYFDKLIQVPIRVPPLGTQEVRSYLMMLFIENSTLDDTVKENIRTNVCEQLAQTWRGMRVDRAFIELLDHTLPTELIAKLDTADRLAPIMTSASQIAGNPRLIKRFLNALAIRMTISHAHGVGVDEAALAKMLLFERCGNPNAYALLMKEANEDEEGKARFLSEWEEKISKGEELKLSKPWDDPFVYEWLNIPPNLSEIDLRGILYVSREHAPLITPEDRLSSKGAELLAAIMTYPDMTSNLKDDLLNLTRPDLNVIMDKVLDRARQEQEWGTPPILDAAITVASADQTLGKRLAAFMVERPPSQIKPSVVPKIGDQPWTEEVFKKWLTSDVNQTVKNAIKQKDNGNITN